MTQNEKFCIILNRDQNNAKTKRFCSWIKNYKLTNFSNPHSQYSQKKKKTNFAARDNEERKRQNSRMDSLVDNSTGQDTSGNKYLIKQLDDQNDQDSNCQMLLHFIDLFHCTETHNETMSFKLTDEIQNLHNQRWHRKSYKLTVRLPTESSIP